MTEAELEMGRLKARLWRAERTIEEWRRYADRLERQIRSLREADTGTWAFDPKTDPIARWYARGAD